MGVRPVPVRQPERRMLATCSQEIDMSFATFLVHVEPDPTTDPRLALTVDLANLTSSLFLPPV